MCACIAATATGLPGSAHYPTVRCTPSCSSASAHMRSVSTTLAPHETS